MRSTLLIACLTTLAFGTPVPQSSIVSSSSTNFGGSSSSSSSSVSNSITSSSSTGGSSTSSITTNNNGSGGSSGSSSTLTTNSNGDVSAYISVRGSNGPYLAIDSITPLSQIPLVPAVTLIQQIVAGLPQNQEGFKSPLTGKSGNISLVLAVGPMGAAVGNDFLNDALSQLSEFFGNRAKQAFQAKLRIVNNRGQPAGQETVIGNITLTQ